MSSSQETNLALFIDFDNVALGARDAHQRFDIQIVLQRLLEKGKIIAKKAYADWSHHKEYLTDLHQAGIELIEIPAPKLTGKNSADIRLVVDAMDMCYGKEHLDTYVIVSGDSDFSPLVSKLRENGKSVIGMGLRNSSSHLLIVNCDEFIFYDDLYIERVGRQLDGFSHVPAEKRKLFEFLISTIQGLLRESRGVLYSSLIKDTMKRKQPEFDEHQHGYSNFGDLLEEGMSHGLLEAIRDSRAGGTWVVTALGKGAQLVGVAHTPSRARGGERRRGGRGRRGEGSAAGAPSGTSAVAPPAGPVAASEAAPAVAEPA
ncbi:MAG: NYN domain-containing protein, partial [Candidatus Krumholzibacteriia bacterium]